MKLINLSVGRYAGPMLLNVTTRFIETLLSVLGLFTNCLHPLPVLSISELVIQIIMALTLHDDDIALQQNVKFSE